MRCSLLDLSLFSRDVFQENPGDAASMRTIRGKRGSFRLRPEATMQSALPRKISKHKDTESVPQTDTGDQVE